MNEHSIELLSKLYDSDDLVDIINSTDLLLENAYEQMDDGCFSEAATLFNIYLSEAKHSSEALNGFAVCLFELENFDQAATVIDYALSCFPDDAVSLANKAALYWERDEHESAIYYYTLSIAIDPDLLDPQLNLISLYRETGDLLLAYTMGLKLKQAHPTNSEIRELVDSLLMDVALMFY